jgi:hypothetical protein
MNEQIKAGKNLKIEYLFTISHDLILNFFYKVDESD